MKQPVARRAECNAAGKAMKKRLILGDGCLCLQHISRISHGCYGKVMRRAELRETHIRIARLFYLFLVLISLLMQRLHKLYIPRSCSKPSFVKQCDRLSRSLILRAPQFQRRHPCNCQRRQFVHVPCPPPPWRDSHRYL